MPVRSRRLFTAAIVGAAPVAVLYTVPADRTAIARAVYVHAHSGGTGHVILYINSAGAAGQLWRQDLTLTPRGFILRDLVLNPGDTLRGFSSVENVNVHGFGSLLLGAPE